MEDQTQPTKTIFCAACQEDTLHTASIDANGEFVFECQNVLTPEEKDDAGNITQAAVLCDRFVKLPADITPDQAADYFAAQKASSSGQVSLEGQELKLVTLLNVEIPDPVVADQATDEASEDANPQE